jgi:membrane protease subunit (stomatin/prohibitin family)
MLQLDKGRLYKMGLIKAAAGAIGTTLADQWKEYIYCDAMDENTLVKKGEVRVTGGSNTKRSDNIITNGSKVAVNEGQFMVIVENGKIVDFTSEAGAYTYNTGTEPSLFDSGFSGLKESFKKVGKRFTYGGQPENDQRVYFINTKEIMNNKIGIGNVPFRDSEFNFTVKIMGYGTYSYRITDPVMFYTNVCANVKDSFSRTQIDEQLKSEVQESMQPALGRIAAKGIAYDQLPSFTKEIGDEVNKELTSEWNELRGISVVSVAFASITVDENSAKKIEQFQESRVYTNTQMMGARLGTAQANAMEAAAANTSGAMQGFMGMGMAMNQGGTNAAQMFQMNQGQGQPQPQQQAPTQPVSDTWKCECGTDNTGKFCTECGKPKPAPVASDEWICECGVSNKGKFCTECGKPKPVVSAEWTCECGSVNSGKFCTECGKPRQ